MGQPNSTRRLSSGDIAAMINLHAAGFDHGWPAEDMTGHIAGDICIGIGEPLAGFIIMRAADDQAEILTLTIDPARRGQGLGGKLLTAAHEGAASAGVDVIFLEVAEDNAPALALYRKAGYAPIGRRPAYYKRANGRVAALTFRKSLDGLEPSG